MGASPISAAIPDTTKQKQMHTASKAPATLSRAEYKNTRCDQKRPMTTARIRNKEALPMIHKIAVQLTLPADAEGTLAAATKPLTTARTTRPMTSSATA